MSPGFLQISLSNTSDLANSRRGRREYYVSPLIRLPRQRRRRRLPVILRSAVPISVPRLRAMTGNGKDLTHIGRNDSLSVMMSILGLGKYALNGMVLH